MKAKFPDLQLIVFDLDGTLIDTREDLTAAVNHTLKFFGRPPLDVDTVTRLVGDGVTRLLQRVLNDPTEDMLQQGREVFANYYSAHLADATRPYPGVTELLQALRGVKKAVLTNKAQEFTEPLLRQLGLDRHFEAVLGGRAGFPAKPDPQGLLSVIATCGAAPEHTLMVGDSVNDVEVGRAAGTFTCAATYGYRPAEELLAHAPDAVIAAPLELLELVGKE